MMICSETYYELYLKDKTADEILSAIRGLKNEIGRLKNIAEHPEYQCTIHPSEKVRISCTREYLERAKQALVDTMNQYECKSLKQFVKPINESLHRGAENSKQYLDKEDTVAEDMLNAFSKNVLKIDSEADADRITSILDDLIIKH